MAAAEFELDMPQQCDAQPARTLRQHFILERLAWGSFALLLPHRQGDQPDATLRASLATVMLLGITIGRRLVKVQLLVDEDRENLVRVVAPALQAVLTGRHRT